MSFADEVRSVLSDTMNLPPDFVSYIPQLVAQNPVSTITLSTTVPGGEIGYDQITVGVNVSSTSSATPTTLISGSAHTFDGAAVIAEFFCPEVIAPAVAGADLEIGLWEGSTAIGVMGIVQNEVAAAPAVMPTLLRLRFTPTAASHTYSIKAWATSVTGPPGIGCGTGTGGAFVPAYLRFTKV